MLILFLDPSSLAGKEFKKFSFSSLVIFNPNFFKTAAN
jgi:hypothetical protein